MAIIGALDRAMRVAIVKTFRAVIGGAADVIELSILRFGHLQLSGLAGEPEDRQGHFYDEVTLLVAIPNPTTLKICDTPLDIR